MVFGPALGGIFYNIAPNLPMVGGAILSVLVGISYFFITIPDPGATITAPAPAPAAEDA